VHCSGRIAEIFSGLDIAIDDALDLDVTLRAHQADQCHEWVNALIAGKIFQARALSDHLYKAGFDAYVTRDIDRAKDYARERYADQPDRRFGLLGSSRATNLAKYGIDTSFQAARAFRDGPWYNDDPSSPYSCCQLRLPAREFSAQGLELDMPILGWGNDLRWEGRTWFADVGRRPKAKDPVNLRLNSYRVLLTRGRDGIIIFVPPEPEMESTAEILSEAGVRNL
jgi:hypothetical protein